jgi:hypothetical protein
MGWAKEPSCFSGLRSKNAEAGGSDVSAAGEVLPEHEYEHRFTEHEYDFL